MRRLRPWPRRSGAIVIPSAQRTVGVGGFRTEARLDYRVESVGKIRCVSVPGRGNRVPGSDDLLALVVPGVEKELRIVGDHAPEQSLQHIPFVQECRVRSRKKAGRVRELARPLGTGGEVESHVKRRLAWPRRDCCCPW